MSKISWGKPKVEYGVSTGGAQAASWKEMPEIRENTATLTTEQGEVTEAKEEGGEIVDVKRAKSKFTFTCNVFVKKGDTAPIPDNDGIVSDDYSLRVTPEDDACTGFVLDCCTVSAQVSYTTAEGMDIVYTFEAKKPASGNTFKRYVKNSEG